MTLRDEHGAECGALAEAVVFLKFFEDLPDPRQSANIVYPLHEPLLLCPLAVPAGAETITDIARFGQTKRAFLRLPCDSGRSRLAARGM